MKLGVKRVAFDGILTGLALVSYILESLLPQTFIPVPGVKIGLSNIFTLVAVAATGFPDAIIIIVARTVLGSLICGTMAALPYSLTAGVVATTLSYLLYRVIPNGKISIVAVSVAGAVAHNLTQNLIFCLVSQTKEAAGYFPILAGVGVISGIITGLLAFLILKTIPDSTWEAVRERRRT